MKKIIFFLSFIIITNNVFADDVTTAFSKCAITKDDKARLICYDKIRDNAVKQYQESEKNGYQSIALDDLKVDIKQMKGKRVVVNAMIQTLGEIAYLKSEAMDMTPIYADYKNLPREDRKKLASNCPSMCQGSFYGIIKNTPIGIGIELEKVSWE